MFSPYSNQTVDNCFTNMQYHKNIECIMTLDLLINFRINGILERKPCFIYAEKMDFKGLIQLRIAEKNDHRQMYITTMDTNSFHALKKDQSLHVTFGGFIENLIKILEDCQAGKLEISLVQQQSSQLLDTCRGNVTNADEFQLQFFEMRTFKNLIHLCLPMKLAPLNVVLFYMNSIIEKLQRNNCAQEHAMQSLQNEVHAHMRRIEQCDLENSKLRQEMIESAKIQTQRHNEELQQMQESLRKASEQRHNDNERNRKAIGALQAQLDQCGAEKNRALSEKCHEQKRVENLKEEVSGLKSLSSNLKEQNEKLHAEISSLRNLERKNEMHLSDMRKHITELQEKLKKFDKAKADLIAELEAEKKIAQTKRYALEMSTAEISKANEIIMKQSQELVKLKKTIGWRTEVALQQEKAINEKEKELQLCQQKVIGMQQTIDGLRLEIPQELESMRKFATSMETKYTEQIKALRSRLSMTGKENFAVHDNVRESLSNRLRK